MSEPNQTAQPAEEMSEQQLSELLQIRRDKLQALQEACLLYTSILAVVMKAPTSEERFADAVKLLDYGFAH